jgi:hypothetical protein
MNFVHSNPNVSISVGLVINKRIVLGIVFAPVVDQERILMNPHFGRNVFGQIFLLEF